MSVKSGLLLQVHVAIVAIGLVLVCRSALLAAEHGNPCSGSETVYPDSVALGADAGKGSYYHDLNLLRTLKLGTAPIFNVDIAQRAILAYRFDTDAVSRLDRRMLEKLYRSRRLIPAVRQADLIYVPARPYYQKQQSLEHAVKQLEQNGYEVVYLAVMDRLADDSEAAGISVVSWDPKRESSPLAFDKRPERPDQSQTGGD